MQIEANYDHKFFTVFSGYRTEEEINPESFTVELTQPLLDVREIRLEYAQFANCIVPYADTSFFWSEVGYSATIPDLNYFLFPNEFMAPNQLMNYIQTQMTTLSPNGYTYTVVINPITGKITWTSTGNFTIFAGLPSNSTQQLASSSWVLGLSRLAEGRKIYPGIPKYFSPEGLEYTSEWPIFNRVYGLAIRIRPWSADTCSNSNYLDNHLFIVPVGTTNYGEIGEYNHLSQWKQNIAFFSPGHSFKRLFFSFVRWIDTADDAVPVKLNADILLRFSYSTYRDTEALSRSIDLKA